MDNVPRNNTETAKLQHSGDLGLEQPVTHYDNTSLPEAFDKHLTDTDGNVIVPETITGVAPETEAPKKKRNKLLITLGSVGAGLALVGGAVFGVKAITDQGENNVPTPDDKATNQPSEAPSPSPDSEVTPGYPEKEFSAETLALPESLSAEEAAKTLFEDRMNQSDNAGKSDAFASEFESAMHSSPDGEVAYTEGIAAQNSKVFTDALFVSDWENNPNLVNSARDLERTNFLTLSLWGWTYHPDPADKIDYPEDKEPYERSQTIDSVETISQTETSAKFNVIFTMHDNRNMNSAPRLSNQPDPNGQQVIGVVEMQKVDGNWKVSDLAFRSL